MDKELYDFLMRVGQEVTAARVKFPTNKHQLVAFGEEAGELFNAMLEYDRDNDTLEHLQYEAIQAAAMAVRVALEGDASFKHGRGPDGP